MLNERDMYYKLCETHGVSVDDNVHRALISTSATSTLDLSGCSLTKETCDIVSKLLISSSTINCVNFNDCLLPPRGLSPLLKSLIHVTNITAVNLKGNNISGSCISKLGHMLRSNSSIKTLCLEWNRLGLFPDNFKEFCSGLAKNSFLEDLDLQNNQLSPECAVSLSGAVSQNNNLKSIDLRWNDIGWQGGQHIYQGLQSNKSVSAIQLQGNCIPTELTQAIEQSVSHNKSCQKVFQDCTARNNLLAKHVQKLEAKHSLEVECLAKRREEIMRETEVRLKSMEEVLNDRNSELAATQVQLKFFQAEIRRLDNERQRFQEQIQELEEEKILESDCKKSEIEKIKKKHQQELDNVNTQLHTLEDQLSAEQRKASELRETHSALDNKIRLLEIEQVSRIEAERKHFEDEMMLLQKAQEERIDKIQKDCDIKIRDEKTDTSRTHQRLTERIRFLETSVFDLERLLSEQSTQVAQMSQDLARSAEITAAAVQEAREKEFTRLKSTEDRLEAVRDEKLQLEKHLETAQRSINQLQEQNNTLILELAEPQRKLSHLHEELAREREMICRLKTEKSEETQRADAKKADADRMQIEINVLSQQLTEAKRLSATSKLEWSEEREKLMYQLQLKEKEIQQMRSEGAERASALYSAFTKYLGNVHPGSPPSFP